MPLASSIDLWRSRSRIQVITWLSFHSGLVTGCCNADEPRAGLVCYVVALTWAAHEFLAAVRSDTAWNRIKARLQEKAIDLSFEAIVAAARQAVAG